MLNRAGKTRGTNTAIPRNARKRNAISGRLSRLDRSFWAELKATFCTRAVRRRALLTSTLIDRLLTNWYLSHGKTKGIYHCSQRYIIWTRRENITVPVTLLQDICTWCIGLKNLIQKSHRFYCQLSHTIMTKVYLNFRSSSAKLFRMTGFCAWH